MDDKDNIVVLEKERPHTHYEECDIPVIYFGQEVSIDWLSYEDNKLKALMQDGVQISNKDAALLANELEDLKGIYGFVNATFDFVNRRDGTTSLIEVRSSVASYGSFILGRKEDHANDAISINPDNKIYIGELRSPEEALFFTECIARYMKYFGVRFPYIQSRFIRDIQTDEHGITHKKRELGFSFILPFVEDFANESKYQTLMSRSLYLKSQNIVMSGNTIRSGDKVIASLVHEKGKRRQYWQVSDLTDSAVAITLFVILSYPLKNKLGC